MIRKCELTEEEQATWGMCPACKAQHGQKCRNDTEAKTPDITFLLGGVHRPRLQNAPRYIEVRPLK